MRHRPPISLGALQAALWVSALMLSGAGVGAAFAAQRDLMLGFFCLAFCVVLLNWALK